MKTDVRKIFLWGLVFSLVVSGLLAIFIFLFSKLNEKEVRVLFSTLDVSACSLAALCCATILNTKFKIFSLVAILICGACMINLLYIIWNYKQMDNYDVVLSLVVLVATCSHISLMLLTQTSTRVTMFVLAATILFITIIAVMLLMLIWQTDQSELFYRLLGVFGILDVLGTIITPILGKTQKYEDAME